MHVSHRGLHRAAALAAQVHMCAAPRVARPAVRLQALGEGGHVISLTAKEAVVMHVVAMPGELLRASTVPRRGKVVLGICTGKGTAYEGSACRKERALTRGASAKGNAGPTLCDACYQRWQRAKAKRSRRAKAK